MKQELANDRGLELAQVDDIPLWVAVSLSLSFSHSTDLTDNLDYTV